MKYYKLLFAVIFLALAIFAVVYFSGTGGLANLSGTNTLPTSVASSTDESLLGERAPFFDLPTVSGDNATLTQFFGKPTILIFWSTWNQQSLDQIKITSDYLGSAGNTDASLVSFLAIDSQEDPSVVTSLIRRSSYHVPFALDSSGATTNQYHIKSLPTIYFIDREGVVREIYAGILSQSLLVDKMEQIIKQ